MGKNPLGLDPRQPAGRDDLFQGFFIPALLLIKEPNPAHPGIHFHMAAHHTARLLGLFGQSPGVLQREDTLRDILPAEDGCHLRRRVSQNQNRAINPAAAQLHRLFHIAHGKPFRSQLLVQPGHRGGAMAVGIRFHHTAHRGFSVYLAANGMIILRQRIQVNLRPGAAQKLIHHKRLHFPLVLSL